MMDTARHAPCPDREYSLIEMIDGRLPPDESRQLQAHLDGCARCRAWKAAYRAVDAGLEAALPRPALSTDFERQLAERIASMEPRIERSVLRDRASLEYQRLLQGLRGSTLRTLALNAVATVFTVIALWLFTRTLIERFPTLAPGLTPDERHLVLGMLGPALALAALAWSVTRGFAPRFGPRG
jgi:anti-sigma factor RsiW